MTEGNRDDYCKIQELWSSCRILHEIPDQTFFCLKPKTILGFKRENITVLTKNIECISQFLETSDQISYRQLDFYTTYNLVVELQSLPPFFFKWPPLGSIQFIICAKCIFSDLRWTQQHVHGPIYFPVNLNLIFDILLQLNFII